jgi:hypothetical protein
MTVLVDSNVIIGRSANDPMDAHATEKCGD